MILHYWWIVLKASKKQDIIYNLAGISDIGDAMKDPIITSKVNILGSIHTLEASVLNKVRRYIFASSIYVLSRQGGFYKSSKQSIENFGDRLSYKLICQLLKTKYDIDISTATLGKIKRGQY